MPATSSQRPILLLLLIPLVSAIPLRAIDGQWRNLGPDGGAVYSLAVQPDDPRVMYAGVDGGVYKSEDAGATWVWAGEGLDLASPVSSLSIDADRASTLYAAQGKGTYKSVDGGLTWTRTGRPGAFVVAAHPHLPGTVFAGTSEGLFRTSNGGALWKRLTRGLPKLYRVTAAVLIDPAAPDRIYAVIEDINTLRGVIFKSTNGGATWRSANSGLKGLAVHALALDRQAPDTLYAGTDDAVFKSTDGGASWTPTGLVGVGRVASLTVHPEQSGNVYAGTASGLFRSRDGGATWSRLSQGLPAQGAVPALVFLPSSPQTVVAGVSFFQGGGVFKSTDEGDTWALSSRGLSSLPVTAVAVDFQRRGTLWVVANAVLFKSTDGGATWARMLADGPRMLQVAVDPLDSSTVYVLLGDGRLGRTRDGGRTWQILAPPLETANRIVIDPQAPATLYVAGGGIAKSTDRGTTWTRIPGEIASFSFFALAISPSDSATLYAGGALGPRQEVLRTTDGGATWTEIQQGLPATALTLAIDPRDPLTAFTSFGGDIYRTPGREATWSLISRPFQNRLALPLAMSDAGTLYAAVWSDNVYASDDGVVWSPLGASPTHSAYLALAADPLDPCRVYAGTYNRGLLAFTKSGTAECR